MTEWYARFGRARLLHHLSFFFALGMGFDKGILGISSITPKRKFMETLGYFHYDPLVIYVHRMTFYLLTHWMILFSNNA